MCLCVCVSFFVTLFSQHTGSSIIGRLSLSAGKKKGSLINATKATSGLMTALLVGWLDGRVDRWMDGLIHRRRRVELRMDGRADVLDGWAARITFSRCIHSAAQLKTFGCSQPA